MRKRVKNKIEKKDRIRKLKIGAVIGGVFGAIIGFFYSLGRIGISGNAIITGEVVKNSSEMIFFMVVTFGTVTFGIIIGALIYSFMKF